MIIDVRRFMEAERPFWEELERFLDRMERDVAGTMDVEAVKRFHYVYERVSADLAKISTFASERETRNYLESLVARAYGEIHETREKPHRFRPVHWFFNVFPSTFRRHLRALSVAVVVTLVGCTFGGAVVALDPPSKAVILPYPHLLQHPSDRVAQESNVQADTLAGRKARGAAFYMTHNTRVAIFTLALGVTWGVGTVLVLLANGIILGAICVDYMLAGESAFLVGWLLPHGSVEIPAVLLAGQAGLILAWALIGRGQSKGLSTRLRDISGDLVTLVSGVAILLVWAGMVEALLSQYHEPVIPYYLKILLGVIESVLLFIFLAFAGRKYQAQRGASGSI